MILVLINGRARFAKAYGAERLTQDTQQRLGTLGKAVLTQSLGDLEDALRSHPPETLTAIVPFGGDGTVSVALSMAYSVYGADRLPAWLVIPAGTMNEIALELGTQSVKPLVAISRLVDLIKQGTEVGSTHRFPMLINSKTLGFAFGFGASSRFLDTYYAQGAGTWTAVKMIARYIGSALIAGPTLRALFKPVTGRVMTEHGQEPMNWTFCLALSVRMLPFRLLLSTSGGPQAEPNLCVVAGKPSLLKLALCLPVIWVGKLPAMVGLSRALHRKITFELDEPMPWHIDGDVCPAVKRLTLEAGPKVKFLDIR